MHKHNGILRFVQLFIMTFILFENRQKGLDTHDGFRSVEDIKILPAHSVRFVDTISCTNPLHLLCLLLLRCKQGINTWKAAVCWCKHLI